MARSNEGIETHLGKKITLVLLFSTLFGCREKNENFRVNMSEIFC